MESVKISGVKRIAINDDPNNVIEFNPTDVLFVERFYAIYREFEAKQAEYDKQSKELDAAGDDITANMEQSITFLKEVCGFMREKIDYLFGEGTSQKVFGDSLSLEMIAQFFEGITPFVWQARQEKVNKYKTTK